LGKQTKNQRRREIINTAVKKSKQSTLDNPSYQFNITKREASKPIKAIIINAIDTTTKEDELILKTEFKLLPSKTSFSKVNFDLYFQEQFLSSTTLGIPQSALLNDTLGYPQVLDMKGIAAGNYLIRVEMYELWSPNERLNFTSKEIEVQYTPQTTESRLVKIPIVRSVADTDLTVISANARNIYREIEQDLKKESISKRDEW
jgi:hypothetical protein